MKIYTKTGDAGETGLFAGPRVPKDDPRIEAYGDVDELNAAIGAVRTESLPFEVDDLLSLAQNQLFDLGAELATPRAAAESVCALRRRQIERLEHAIDEHEARLEPLKQFILPGGTRGAAMLHVARTVCRRAERRVVTLQRLSQDSEAPISKEAVMYLNRLSDLLFVLARFTNLCAAVPDVPWRKGE